MLELDRHPATEEPHRFATGYGLVVYCLSAAVLGLVILVAHYSADTAPIRAWWLVAFAWAGTALMLSTGAARLIIVARRRSRVRTQHRPLVPLFDDGR